MILTRDYKPIWASLDRPLPFQRVFEQAFRNRVDLMYVFEVGPIVYKVDCMGENGTFWVSFEVKEITGTDEEFREHLSQTFKREVTPEEVKKIKSRSPQGNMGIGNAPAVFATVMAIIKDMIGNFPAKCLIFSTIYSDKANVYRKMFRTSLPGWEIVDSKGGSFTVCKKE